LKPGSHSLYAHYRGDTNWQSANSTTKQIAPPSFSVSVSPNPLAFAAGKNGNGTVTITPSGGFAGVVTLACATGGTFLPASYSCSFGQTNVTVNNAPATTTLTLSPSSSTSTAVKSTIVSGSSEPFTSSNSSMFAMSRVTLAFLVGLTLLALFGLRSGAPKIHRNFLAASGLILCVTSIVLGCGGGGGGGGGPYSTTTTMVSTNLDASFGTPVTFTVTVKPSGSVTPTGMVQLYDNGQVYGSAAKVSAGIATFQASTLPVGVHNLKADYLGDAKTLASTSVPIAQIITGQVPLQITGMNNANTETFNFTVVVE
jgi:Bacterial Ig-like domain (group 3)